MDKLPEIVSLSDLQQETAEVLQRMLIDGEKEIAADEGHDFDDVMREADMLIVMPQSGGGDGVDCGSLAG